MVPPIELAPLGMCSEVSLGQRLGVQVTFELFNGGQEQHAKQTLPSAFILNMLQGH